MPSFTVLPTDLESWNSSHKNKLPGNQLHALCGYQMMTIKFSFQAQQNYAIFVALHWRKPCFALNISEASAMKRGENFQQCRFLAKILSFLKPSKGRGESRTAKKYRFLRNQKWMWRKIVNKVLWFDYFFRLLIMIGDKVNELFDTWMPIVVETAGTVDEFRSLMIRWKEVLRPRSKQKQFRVMQCLVLFVH